MQPNTIIEFQKGDKHAYQQLFMELYPVMCRFSNNYLYDYNDAEDITQEVFIELWNQRSKFENQDQIKAFLYLSIKNKCLNFIKHLAIREKYFESELERNEEDFDEFVLEAEVVQNIYTAIESLSEQRKKIILLSMEGLKNNEIAEDLSISINTVKLQKKIAYQQLREKLKTSVFLFLLFF